MVKTILSKLLQLTVFLGRKHRDRNPSHSEAKSHVFPHQYVFAEFMYTDVIHKEFCAYYLI